MQVDLLARLTWQVDPAAEPADLDRVLARFLLAHVRNRSTAPGPSPPVEVVSVNQETRKR